MKTMVKRSVSMVLVLLTLFGFIAVPVSAIGPRYDTITGRIPKSGWTSGQDVYTNGEKAKLRICTFTQSGSRKSGNIVVKAEGDNGQVYYFYVKGCNLNNNTNITLPKGNTHYKVSIKRDGDSNKNKTNCFYFSIDFKSNCWYW